MDKFYELKLTLKPWLCSWSLRQSWIFRKSTSRPPCSFVAILSFFLQNFADQFFFEVQRPVTFVWKVLTEKWSFATTRIWKMSFTIQRLTAPLAFFSFSSSFFFFSLSSAIFVLAIERNFCWGRINRRLSCIKSWTRIGRISDWRK